jgi:protein involved in polysaccharide export with SLBB domain
MRRPGLLILMLLLAAAPVAAQSTAAPVSQAPSGAREGGLMPGDLLRVIVSREPDLTLEQTIPADGILDFHRLGPKDVRGHTVEQMRELLVREYSRYLVNPTIRVEAFRKVQVLGAVRKPDIYALPPTSTISDAIATAGGVLPEGRTDRAELRREGKVVDVLLLSDRTPLADSPVQSGDQIYVPERSFASRNSAAISTAASGVLALLIALLVR